MVKLRRCYERRYSTNYYYIDHYYKAELTIEVKSIREKLHVDAICIYNEDTYNEEGEEQDRNIKTEVKKSFDFQSSDCYWDPMVDQKDTPEELKDVSDEELNDYFCHGALLYLNKKHITDKDFKDSPFTYKKFVNGSPEELEEDLTEDSVMYLLTDWIINALVIQKKVNIKDLVLEGYKSFNKVASVTYSESSEGEYSSEHFSEPDDEPYDDPYDW